MDDDDNNIQKPIQVPLKRPRQSIQLDSTDRQRSIEKLNEACRLRDKTTVTLSDYETLVKNFEERVFSDALHKQDYLDRISLKIEELEQGRSRGANSRMPNPATGNVESRDSNRSQMPPPTIRTSSRITDDNSNNILKPNRVPLARQRYIELLIKAYKRRCPKTVTLSEIEMAAKTFEKQVFSVAFNSKDYVDRISARIKRLQYHIHSGAAYSPTPDSAAGNVQDEDRAQAQTEVQPHRTPTNGEKHVVAEPFRERTYKRIVTMRRKYAPQLEKLYDNVNSKLKMLSSQGYNSNQRKFEKLNELCMEVGFLEDLLEVLNISADELKRGQEKYITSLEKIIVSYLNSYFEPGNTSTSLEPPGLPQNDHPKKTQETSSSVPSLPPLVKSPGIPPSSLQELREEIEEVNQKLINTQVSICEKEDTNPVSSGIVIKCLFHGASVFANLKSIILCYLSSSTTLVEPLRLLVPTDYPKSLPVLLGEVPGETGDAFLDVSSKARSKLVKIIRGCKKRIMVSDIAQTWEVCVREVIVELADRYG